MGPLQTVQQRRHRLSRTALGQTFKIYSLGWLGNFGKANLPGWIHFPFWVHVNEKIFIKKFIDCRTP